jgi:hypothetical protein
MADQEDSNVLAELLAVLDENLPSIRGAVIYGSRLETGGITGASEAIQLIAEAARRCVEVEKIAYSESLRALEDLEEAPHADE